MDATRPYQWKSIILRIYLNDAPCTPVVEYSATFLESKQGGLILKHSQVCKCLLSSDISIDLSSSFFETELQRETPWVRKIGKPSNRENLVMASPYERPWSVQTVGERGASQYEPVSYAVESSQHSLKIFRFPLPPSVSRPNEFLVHIQ